MPPDSVALGSPLASQDARSCSEREVFAEIERLVGARNFDHWFRGRATLSFSDEGMTVGVASGFLLTWMQKHFRDQIAEAAEKFLGPSVPVRFEIDARVALKSPTNGVQPVRQPSAPASAVSQAVHPTTSEAADSAKTLLASATESAPAAESQKPQSSAGRRFADLADFVSGPGSELALMAARQVCDSPGARFNPLYLHGGTGIGKTHLLEGIYRRIRKQHPAMQVLYLTSEAFANHFTQALREHKLPGFRQRFRGVDVLLVDDVDFFDGKRVIQEEFLHTFQQLESHGRQIVAASDRHPRLLTKISDDLSTRLVSGLVCKLDPPDFETRLKIVERKAAGRVGDISPEAMSYVAQRFCNNVRELVGALNGLESYHALTRKRITLAAARAALANLEQDGARAVGIPEVEQTVCRLFGVEPRDLRSPRRQRVLSEPRMLAMFLIRKHTHAAYSQIGEHFGGRNHSTVIAAEKRVRDMIASGAPIRVVSRVWRSDELVDLIEQQLQAG